ncbi:hypothetical protein, partial [Burkholderia sp. SIMBA_024]|uniref:hypothetical protein n=1 Tax=Burkholderia sp. SIMBA_024 TaxID=3085768 RepID=UPI00397C4BF7
VGLLIIPLYWAPKLINLLIGLLGLVGTIVLGVKLLTVPFLIVLGLAAGQYRLLEKIQKGLPFLRHIWLISFLGTVGGVGWMWWAAPPEAMSPFLYETAGATLPSEEQANMDA